MDASECVSGFIEIGTETVPAEHIEPLDRMCGSTCLCYLVHHQGKRLLMKRLRPEFVTNPRYIEIFHKEFETGSKLSNPHIVNYVSIGEDSKGPYLVMEYVDGETLAEKIQRDPTYFADTARVSRLFTQLLSALSCLHNREVLHLDLKPDNVMLTRISDNVKLIDLGYCYSDSYYNSMGCNKAYAAPEQLKADIASINVSTDLYAVGRMLQVISLLDKKLSRNTALNAVIDRSVAADPSKRYSSAQEMSEALTLALKPRNLKRHLLWSLVNALALLTLVKLFLWWNNGDDTLEDLNASELYNDTPRGMVAYYPFDGNACDVSGFGNDGILSDNPPQLTTDRFGNANSAYRFGGFDNPNWIVVPQSKSLSFYHGASLSAWICIEGADGMNRHGTYDTNGMFALWAKGGDGIATPLGMFTLVAAAEDSSVGTTLWSGNSVAYGYQMPKRNFYFEFSESSFRPDVWINLTLTVASHRLTVYVNGKRKYIESITDTNFITTNAMDLYIGILGGNLKRWNNGDPYWFPFNGKIDDIRIFNYELSQKEVKALCDSPDEQ